MTYKINSIFQSLQGEGYNSGTLSVFIRFAKCNLDCWFCDTEFQLYKEMTRDQIAKKVRSYPAKNIIFTGGEPLLQLDENLLDEFYHDYFISIETNGTIKPKTEVSNLIDHITISPKVGAKYLRDKWGDDLTINELRYPIKKGDPIPEVLVKAQNKFISPLFDDTRINRENIDHCLKLLEEHPDWRLSLQTHKWLEIE